MQPHCWPALRPLPQQSRAWKVVHCRRGVSSEVVGRQDAGETESRQTQVVGSTQVSLLVMTTVSNKLRQGDQPTNQQTSRTHTWGSWLAGATALAGLGEGAGGEHFSVMASASAEAAVCGCAWQVNTAQEQHA